MHTIQSRMTEWVDWEPIPVTVVVQTKPVAKGDGPANMACLGQDGMATSRQTFGMLTDNTTTAATTSQVFMRGRLAQKVMVLRRAFDESSTALLFNVQRDLHELCKHLS